MSERNFVDQWLTIRTKSKFASQSPPRDPKKDVHPMLGEKVIGRLTMDG